MGPILWIDQNELVTGLVERALKAKHMPFYGLKSAQDFDYLIRDLNPSLIVLDPKTCLQHLDAFKRQYEATQGFLGKPVVLLEASDELGFLDPVKGIIGRPFNPFELPEVLSKFILNA